MLNETEKMDKDFINNYPIIELDKSKSLTISSEREKQDIPKYLTADEINQRLSQMKAGQDMMLITFLWLSGVRISEAVSLKKGDIDFNSNLMTVRWLKSRKYKNRVVPIHRRLSGLLKFYVGNMNQEDIVFPISRQRAFQITKQHLNCSPHQLRHSFAVNWLKHNGDIVVLHRILGHSKIQTTMEYLKIVPIDQAKELDKIKFD